jgi:hypothetical protein
MAIKDVQVATYYFPNWGPVKQSEWQLIQAARPKFPGHLQPKVPEWGYENENDPVVMSRKVDAAADHGIDAFIFDWYYYDAQKPQYGWDGSKYLYMALEDGFLKAPNRDRLKFALMWCNHDLGPIPGAVQPATFDALCDYVIKEYFHRPSYWKIDGCPYFSIYQIDTFIQTFGGDQARAAEALQRFRDKVKAAGFPDLHLNAVLWGLRGDRDGLVRDLAIDSTTSYVWIHHYALPNLPATDYAKAGEGYFNAVEKGGGHNGLETPATAMPAPYHVNVSMGWDSSPRCNQQADWMSERGYPFGPVITNNTPAQFQKALGRAREIMLQRPARERIITINSWNEWGEGSYLEPDMQNGTAYLEAVRAVFGEK